MLNNKLQEKILWNKLCIGVNEIILFCNSFLIVYTLGARLYEKNPELIERDMKRIIDVNSQHRYSNGGGYELIYDIKRPVRQPQSPTTNRNISQDEYRRPGSLKEMKADLTRALQTILSEDIIDLGIR